MRAISSRRAELVERLVRQHQASVRGYLAFLGCPARLLDDLVQDVFLSVLSSGFEERNARSTSAYLRRAARHLLLKTLQRERLGPPHVDLTGAEEAWGEFEREDGGAEYLDALRECLGHVRERAHDVLRMRYGDCLERAAIAERLRMSESGVKSILVRTRQQLRNCIERRLEP